MRDAWGSLAVGGTWTQVAQHPGMELGEPWPGVFCDPSVHRYCSRSSSQGQGEGDEPAGEAALPATAWG